MSLKKLKKINRNKILGICVVIFAAILILHQGGFLQTQYIGLMPLDASGTVTIDVDDYGEISTVYTSKYQSIDASYLTLNAYLWENDVKVATGIATKGVWTYSFVFDYETSVDAVYEIEYRGKFEPPDIMSLAVGQISDPFTLADYGYTAPTSTTTTTTTNTGTPPPEGGGMNTFILIVSIFGAMSLVLVFYMFKQRQMGGSM